MIVVKFELQTKVHKFYSFQGKLIVVSIINFKCIWIVDNGNFQIYNGN